MTRLRLLTVLPLTAAVAFAAPGAATADDSPQTADQPAQSVYCVIVGSAELGHYEVYPGGTYCVPGP